MNHGNNKPGSIDDFVDKINKILGKLLGKKNNNKPRHKTSQPVFIVITIVSCLLFWFSTGIYYLDENEYGIVLVNGHVSSISKGLKVGFSFPYPFGEIKVIDAAPSQLLNIGGINQSDFIVMDKNLTPFAVSAKAVYKITDPYKLYVNYLQRQDNFDNEIIWNIKTKIRSIVANSDFMALNTINLTVLSGMVNDSLTSSLAQYGVILTKFNITDISAVESTATATKKTKLLQPDVNSLHMNVDVDVRNFSREVNRSRNIGWND